MLALEVLAGCCRILFGQRTVRKESVMVKRNPLLIAGVVAGPIFIVVAFIQVLIRQGFDLSRQPISLLSLGDGGWIQIVNFELTGLLMIASAFGLRRALRSGRASVWGPLLFGVYGLGFALAGIFLPDPAMGFPPGSPPGMPASMSWHAGLHQIAFSLAFLSLVVACFVFARWFSGLRRAGWTLYSIASGITPVLMIGLSMGMGGSGVPLFVMGVITSAWITAVSVYVFLKEGSLGPGNTHL